MFVPTEAVTSSPFIRYEVWASLRGCLVRTDHPSGHLVRELEVVASSSMEAAALAFDAYRGELLPDSTILTVILGGKTMTWDCGSRKPEVADTLRLASLLSISIFAAICSAGGGLLGFLSQSRGPSI